MRTLLLAAVTAAGLALTASPADAQYRGLGGYRGGYYNRPVYSNGFVARPYTTPYYGRTFSGGAYGVPYGSGFYPAFGDPYPRSTLNLSFGTGGFYPGYGYGGYGGYGGGFYPGFGYRRW